MPKKKKDPTTSKSQLGLHILKDENVNDIVNISTILSIFWSVDMDNGEEWYFS